MATNSSFFGDQFSADRPEGVLTGTLKVEQLFQLEMLRRQIEGLSPDDAKDYLLELFRQMMIKDNLVKEMFKDCYL